MPILDIFWTILWFFLFFIWIWMLISIFGDIFRSDMSGWGKAGWSIFIVFLPFLGVLIYLIVHGGDMQERSVKAAGKYEQAQRDYIQSVAGSGSTAHELAKLADLKNQGVISDQEFEAQKPNLLA